MYLQNASRVARTQATWTGCVAVIDRGIIAAMDPEELRREGVRFIEWLADFHERVESLPVRSQNRPGDVRAQLPPSAPQEPESYAEILSDVARIIEPGLTHWQSPNFFAYFPANISAASVFGELMSAGFGVQGMLWTTSPACTELETHMLDWMRDALGLPAHFDSAGEGGGVIQDSASSATLCAMLAARERATEGESNTRGLFGGAPLVAYGTEHAHSSLEKAARICGVGSSQLHLIEVDDQLAMRPEELDRRIREDIEAGLRPFLVNAVVGTTSTNAIDPLPGVAQVCRAHGVWLHVDAAMSGIAALCPEFRKFHDGVEGADSYTVNAHKWMLTNFDCNLFWVRSRAALTGALGLLPEYLNNRASASGEVIDYRDWQIPLGRRFRALKLWFVLRRFGLQGLQAMVRGHVALAREFAGWVADHPDFEVSFEAPLNLVCFRHVGSDEVNQRLLETVNDSGQLYLTHTKIDGVMILRMSIGGAATTRAHVERAWSVLLATASQVQATHEGA